MYLIAVHGSVVCLLQYLSIAYSYFTLSSSYFYIIECLSLIYRETITSDLHFRIGYEVRCLYFPGAVDGECPLSDTYHGECPQRTRHPHYQKFLDPPLHTYMYRKLSHLNATYIGLSEFMVNGFIDRERNIKYYLRSYITTIIIHNATYIELTIACSSTALFQSL
jgi:hypothetical protein